ncbi:Galactose oxidase/kelch, beta-propeller [Pseudocohnilembus persalinus]|uniref:Galactose oxidase/kelch, beta-propeller n=1 Tax=Pseudocohnilembus persalinus TaxID=266149 RepID=A0A0V0QY89_PSEPJ|nr:Galactose oxidase/kelch, beta-propeller [Pseudocohnilembus persalinus]|eukprot:KRX07166.1 Galactose oxidase/kelch, beta-propeller [Pseudocohnilembus persalinus]
MSQYWSQLKIQGFSASNRSNATIVNNGDRIYLYGGEELGSDSVNNGFLYLDYYSQDKQNYLMWQKVEEKNPEQSPGNLQRHSTVLINDKIFIYGGKKNMVQYSNNSIYIFDLKTNVWTQKQAPDYVPCMDSHTCCIWEIKNEQNQTKDTHLVIYGGFNIAGYQENIYSYNIEQDQWLIRYNATEVHKNLKNQSNQIEYNIQKQSLPKPRSNHASVIYNDCLYVYGGNTINNEKLGDFWQFNLMKSEWKFIAQSNQPGVRSGHSLSIWKDQLIIFGGMRYVMKELNDLYVFCIKQNVWKQLEQQQDLPQSIKNQNSILLESNPKVDFSQYKSGELSNYDLKKYFIGKEAKKKEGVNTLYGHIRKIKLTPLLSDQQKLEKIRENGKKIMMLEFQKIDLKQNKRSEGVTENMKLAIKQVQKTHRTNDKQMVYQDQKQDFQQIQQNQNNRIEGKRPLPRDGHTCCVIQQNGVLILFGGDRHRLTFNDIYELNLQKIDF